LATTSGNDPLSPGRQPCCDTCRISGLKLAADLRLERSASGLIVRFPHPVGLSAMEKDLERGAGIEPASSAWKAKAQSH
jgi:hypothetical protein